MEFIDYFEILLVSGFLILWLAANETSRKRFIPNDTAFSYRALDSLRKNIGGFVYAYLLLLGLFLIMTGIWAPISLLVFTAISFIFFSLNDAVRKDLFHSARKKK